MKKYIERFCPTSTRLTDLTQFSSILTGNSSHNKSRKGNKSHKYWKWRYKTVIITADMTVYGQNPTELKKTKTKKQTTAINSRQCKVNSHINQLYFYRLTTSKFIMVSETNLL